MSARVWELIPRKGIKHDDIMIALGSDRTQLKKLLSRHFRAPIAGSFPDEDDFLTPDESTFVRVRYQDEQARDIEFLGGVLRYQGIDLHSGTTFPDLEESLGKKGMTFQSTTWLGAGMDCPALGMNIATRQDVGGDGDEIEWVILSSNFP